MKRNLVLFSFVLLAGLLAPALDAAAQVAFQMSGSTRDVRIEGTAEAVGPVALAATTAGTIKAGSSISLNYGTAVEAGTGTVTCSAAACVAGTDFTVAVSGNILTITFVNDVVFAIGNSIAVSGVRVNANTFVGTTINAAGTTSVPAASASTNPITFFIVSSVAVATIQSPATTVVVTPAGGGILTCVASNSGAFSVSITERFNQALTSEVDEDGFGGTGVAGANSVDTVVRISFANVPIGVGITFVSTVGTSGTLTLVGTPVAGTTLTSATGAQTLNFDLAIDVSSTTGANEKIVANFTASSAAAIALGSVTQTAAVSLRGGVSPSVPRFVTNTQGSGTAFGTSDCVTNLLFPFTTAITGFDTGIAIANTTDDDPSFGTGIGATKAGGACNLVLYPTNRGTGGGTGAVQAPIGPVSTGTLAGGETFLATMSGSFSSKNSLAAFAGGEGYIIAQCGFLNAHAFAFITDTGGAVAQGYVALVIPNPTLVSRSTPAGGAGESLGE